MRTIKTVINQLSDQSHNSQKDKRNSITTVITNIFFVIIIWSAFFQIGCKRASTDSHKNTCIDYKRMIWISNEMETNERESHGFFLKSSNVVAHCKKGLILMNDIKSILSVTTCENCKERKDVDPILKKVNDLEKKLKDTIEYYQ